MKTGDFKYSVQIKVEFTETELAVIEACMVTHYDRVVREAAEQGGFLFGWKNRVEICGPELVCSSDELDTCGKALEQAATTHEFPELKKARDDLRSEIVKTMQKLGAEWERMNPKATT